MSFFGNLAGVGGALISARATAEVAWEPLRYALMAMNDTACNTLEVGGTGGVTIVDTSLPPIGGGTYTESNSTCPSGALSVGGTSYLKAISHEVVGDADYNVSPCPTPPGGGCLTGTVLPSSGFPDPWATLVPPVPPMVSPWAACKPVTTYGGSTVATITEGRYCTELRVSGGARVSVAPGVYILERGMNVNVNTGGFFCSQTFNSANVAIFAGECPLDSALSAGNYRAEALFYSTCNPTPCTPPVSPSCNPASCSGETAGSINFQGGGGAVNLTGESDYENILFWIDRTSQVSPKASVTLVGGSNMNMRGHTYALTSDVEVRGNNASEVLRLNMTILADKIVFGGSSAIEMAWDFATAAKIKYIALIE
jgi:hypothetical protein